MSKNQPVDRRVQKTHRSLREALATLVHEKSYDEIAVTEILARANVGRSTFYMHFHDKDELLVSCIHDILGLSHHAAEASARTGRKPLLWFSLPLFEHIERHRDASRWLIGARGRAQWLASANAGCRTNTAESGNPVCCVDVHPRLELVGGKPEWPIGARGERGVSPLGAARRSFFRMSCRRQNRRAGRLSWVMA